MKEGERTGTQRQHGAERQKLKLDQCMKVERALSPTASVPMIPVLFLSITKSVLQWYHCVIHPAEPSDTPEWFGQNVG